jgi:hypothetical protein
MGKALKRPKAKLRTLAGKEQESIFFPKKSLACVVSCVMQ